METSLEHLSPEKRELLERAVAIIREMCDDVEMIILFGSHARGDYRDEEDLPDDRKSGAPSDFDILAVCKHRATAAHHRLWHSIEEHCNGRLPDKPFRIIAHDVAYIKKRLKQIHYFFSDIVREGRLLYDSGKYKLNVGKELSPEEQTEVMEEHFKLWFESSKDFFINYSQTFAREGYRNAAFQLHQAAESSYKALLLVFTNYCPHNHFLAAANEQVQEILPDMEEIFPCANEAENDRFKNFDYAYIGARYDPKYEISREDLEYLAGRVKRLLELTVKFCRKRIAASRDLQAGGPA
ncbi:MAG: HEPN domain-containing protein [Victivallales bacterium]|nr:HEPN domain-containing protein [Victivallales bacterium]